MVAATKKPFSSLFTILFIQVEAGEEGTMVSIMAVKRTLSDQEQDAYKTINDTLVFQDANILGEWLMMMLSYS